MSTPIISFQFPSGLLYWQFVTDQKKPLFIIDTSRIQIYSLFAAFTGSRVSKPLRERVVVDLQLSDFFILVRSHSDELTLFEHVRSESWVWQL